MKKRNCPALDGWRGLMIALVVFSHTYFPRTLVGAEALIRGFGQEAGGFAIDLFFSLSGYLISRELLRERDFPGAIGRYFIRRALRILPLYYAILFFLTLFPFESSFSVWGEARAIDRHVSLSDWLFFRNFTMAYTDQWPKVFLLVSWSLCVEIQFYVVWPFLITRFDPKTMARICWGLVAVALGARIQLAPDWRVGVYLLPFCRVDSFAFGGLLALWARAHGHHRIFEGRRALAFASVVAMVTILSLRALGHSLPFIDEVRHTFYGLFGASGVAVLVARWEQGGSTGWLETRPFRLYGKYSYGIYLFHLIPIRLFYSLPLPWGVIVVLNFAGAFAMAFVVYQLYEKFFLGLQNRFRAIPLEP